MSEAEISIEATVDESTHDESARGAGRDPRPRRKALLMLWSRAEPWRAGSVCFAPRRSRDAPVIVGRGTSSTSTGVRGTWICQRPGHNETTPPLGTKSISREQLQVSVHERGVELRNVGRCPLIVDGHAVERASLPVGGIAHLGEQLCFMVTERPLRMSPLRDAPPPEFAFSEPDPFGMVGESPVIWELRDRLAFVAARDLHVLILGPSGSGKELAARAIHGGSKRASRPLISRNASTIPGGLMDAELFGNVRDYPNPGMKERRGLIGLADGATLFLDEIGEIPEALQAHLLRVLDADGEYQRLGEDRVRQADLRVVAATNRGVEELKHDLVPRLTLHLSMPDLFAHPEDIPLLCQHVLREQTADDPELVRRFADVVDSLPWFRLAPQLIEALVRRPHPLHVRGLIATLWRCLQASSGSWVELAPDTVEAPKRGATRPESLDRATVLEALEAHGWVVKDVWPALGLNSRHQLRRLMKKLEIAPQGRA